MVEDSLGLAVTTLLLAVALGAVGLRGRHRGQASRPLAQGAGRGEGAGHRGRSRDVRRGVRQLHLALGGAGLGLLALVGLGGLAVLAASTTFRLRLAVRRGRRLWTGPRGDDGPCWPECGRSSRCCKFRHPFSCCLSAWRISPAKAQLALDPEMTWVVARVGQSAVERFDILPRLKAEIQLLRRVEQQLRFAVHGPGNPVASPRSHGVPRRDVLSRVHIRVAGVSAGHAAEQASAQAAPAAMCPHASNAGW